MSADIWNIGKNLKAWSPNSCICDLDKSNRSCQHHTHKLAKQSSLLLMKIIIFSVPVRTGNIVEKKYHLKQIQRMAESYLFPDS